MLQIKSVYFSKGDFLYTIEYFDGKKVLKISTNEEALGSMDLAKDVLQERLREHLFIDPMYKMQINSIKFGKNDDCASCVQINARTSERAMGIVTKIFQVSPKAKNPDEKLVSLAMALNELRGEIERYINGERAQMTLDFEEK